MTYQDRTLKCVECGSDFIFSADGQEYHASKGFMNDPKRCTTCRERRRAERGGGGGFSGGYGSRPPRQMYPVVCAQCGKETEVPFQPTGDRPVYCSDCFNRDRPSSGYGSRPQREMFPAICSECGKDTQVPFQPRGDKPVYCSDCFSRTRPSRY
jgi:CxxC-x17-CxxC domain-containing protein